MKQPNPQNKIELISILKKDRNKVYSKVMELHEWKNLNKLPEYEYHAYQLGYSAYPNKIKR